MSGPITDLPIRVCPSCGTIRVSDDRMYIDPDRCPRCGGEYALSDRIGAGGSIRTPLMHAVVLGTQDGFGLATESGFPLRITPASRWD